MAWVARIFGRVVVSDLDVDASAFWKWNGVLVLILVLPTEIPVLDPEKPLLAPTGKRGDHLHVLGEIMRVAADRQPIDINGQDKGILDLECPFSGRNIDAGANA